MVQGLLTWGLRRSIEDAVKYRNRFIRSGRIDPWDSCEESIRSYRPVLENIAKKISELSQEKILSGYNLETGKIELYGEVTREIIAFVEIRISDNGSCVIVETPRSLHTMPDNLKALFVDAFLIRVDFR